MPIYNPAVTRDGIQTLTNKTLVAPVLGAATGTSLSLAGDITLSTGAHRVINGPEGVYQIQLANGGGNLTVTGNGTLVLTTAAGTNMVIGNSTGNIYIGPNGTTNPSVYIDENVASQATGLRIQPAAAAGGLNLIVLSSGTDESLKIDAKGAGTITLNATATGGIILSRAVTLSSTINKLTLTAPASAATLTLADGSSLITSGAYSLTLTATAATNVTLPTTGTLITLAGTETLTNKTLTSPSIGGITGLTDITVAPSSNFTFGGTALTNFNIGANGTANPNLYIQLRTANVTGLYIVTGAAASGLGLEVLSSGTDESLKIDAKGAGTITIGATSTGNVVLGGTGMVKFNYAVVALGGGAAPTVGTIGGSGPATAGQNSWLKVDVGGTTSYIPIWR